MPRWIPDGPAIEADLLREIGLTDPDELFRDVPRKVRLGPPHDPLSCKPP